MDKQLQVLKLSYKNPNLAEQCRNQVNEFRKNGKFCDWSLKTEDESKFPVHKLVLASASEFFRGLLESDMIESREEEIVLQDITGENMKLLLSYIYTGEIEITTENMKDIFRHASFYQLIELETATTEFILQSITNDNYLELWEFGEHFMNAKIEKDSIAYVLKNANKLFDTSQIQDLTLEKINKLMAACVENDIDVKLEYKLMENWMSKDFTIRETYFKSLLDQIDFSKFDQEFVVTVITKNEQFKQNRDFLLKLVDLYEMYFKMIEDKNVSTDEIRVVDSYYNDDNYDDSGDRYVDDNYSYRYEDYLQDFEYDDDARYDDDYLHDLEYNDDDYLPDYEYDIYYSSDKNYEYDDSDYS